MRPGIRRILKWLGIDPPTETQMDALDPYLAAVLASEREA